ncbi:MAG: DUF427 domain-containing protein [Alphaproteobacteria bacterium]
MAERPTITIDDVAGSVRVVHAGAVVAESRRARVLREGNLVPRWYIPREDVLAELVPSERHSVCPWKGTASYYGVKIGEKVHPDLVWYYPDATPETKAIENYLCFYNEKVDRIEVNDEK